MVYIWLLLMTCKGDPSPLTAMRALTQCYPENSDSSRPAEDTVGHSVTQWQSLLCCWGQN